MVMLLSTCIRREAAPARSLAGATNAWRRRHAYSTAETSQEHTGAMGMRRVRVGCEFVYVAAVDTPAVFQIEPRDAAPVSLGRRDWSTEPEVRIRHYTDLYGNPCARAMLPAGRSTLRFGHLVLVPDATEAADEQAPELPPEELPDGVLIYTLPSRYCLPDALGDEAWSRFGAMPAGYSRVQAICGYVHSHLTFEYGRSHPRSTGADVNAPWFGLWRDFPHLASSVCPGLELPARCVLRCLPSPG